MKWLIETAAPAFAALIGIVAIALSAIYIFYAIVTPSFEGTLFCAKYLSLPLGLAIALRARHQWKYRMSRTSMPSMMVAYILIFCLLVVAIEWVNTAFISNKTLLIHGVVTQMRESHGRGGGGRWIYIQDPVSGNEVALEVPVKEYEKASVGSYFGACFQIGWLGIPFRWRHSDGGTCTFIHAPPATH